MPPQNLSTPTSQEKDHAQEHHHHLLQQHHQQQQQHQFQQQQQQHMSQSLVEQPHGISGGAEAGAMSDQGHSSSHASLDHAHSMAEHAAHSMLDLSETGNSLEHLAGGGGGGGGHSSGHTHQSLADLAHRRPDQGLDSGSRREGLGLSSDGGGGGSLTPTLHQMNQHGDGRADLPGLGAGGSSGSSNGGGAGSLLPRPMSGLGGVTERQSMSQPMRNLTPIGGVDSRGDGGRVSVGLPGSGGHSLQDQGGNNNGGGQSSSLSFSPDSGHHHHQSMLSQQRIPIIPKRGRPPGSGSSQHSLGGLHLHRGPLSSSSSLHGHHHSSHNQAGIHMRGLSEHQHNSHHGSSHPGDSSSHNGRAGLPGGIYSLDNSSGHQLNSRPGSVLMSEPSDSRDVGGRSSYSMSSSSGERNHSTSSSHSTSLIEETIAAVASNLHRSSPNGGIMPGPLPPNSHPPNSLMGGLGGLLPPRSNSTLGHGGPGDDSLADLVGRGHSHGIPMLSERASQSLSGLIDDGDGSGGHNHQSHHHSLHHPGHPSSSGGGGREIEKTHPCLTCLKMFRSKQQLAQHSLVHTGIRKHICTFCDRAFKQLSHLQQHVRIHTGEKPYRCKFENCERAFAQLSNLQHHMRNHDDQVKKEATRIHKCQICHRCYTNESSLKAHTLKMHIHIKPIDQHALAMGKKRRKRKNKDLYGGAPTMVPVSSSDGGPGGFNPGSSGGGLGVMKGSRARSPTSSDEDEIIFVGEQGGGSSRMDNFGIGGPTGGLGGQGQMLGQGSGGRGHDLGPQIPFSSSFSRSADPLALLASANRFGLQDNMMPGLGSGLGSGLNSFSDQLAFRDAALLNSRFGDLRGGAGSGGSGGLSSSSGGQGGPPGSGFDDRFLGSGGSFGGGSGGLGGQLNQQQLSQRDRDGFGDLGGSSSNRASNGATPNGMQGHSNENRNLAHNQGMLRGSGLGGSNSGGMGMGGMMGGMMGPGGAGGLMKQIKQEPMDYFPSSCHGGPGSDQFGGMGMGMGGSSSGGFLSPQHLINSHLRGQLPSLNVPLIRDHFSSHGQMLPSTAHTSSSSASSSGSSTTTPVTNNQPLPPSSSTSSVVHPPSASTPSSMPLAHPGSSSTPSSLSSLPLPLSHMGLYQHQSHFAAPRGLLHPSPASTPSSQLSVGGGAGQGLPSNLSTHGARSPLEQEDLRCFSPLRN